MSARTIAFTRTAGDVLAAEGDHVIVNNELRYLTAILDIAGNRRRLITAPAQDKNAVPTQTFNTKEDVT